MGRLRWTRSASLKMGVRFSFASLKVVWSDPTRALIPWWAPAVHRSALATLTWLVGALEGFAKWNNP